MLNAMLSNSVAYYLFALLIKNNNKKTVVPFKQENP
jgi:hypothetical protein